MTRRRAFWDAAITVCSTNFLVWAILFPFLRRRIPSDEWPFCIFISLLSLLLIIPMYHRNLRGRDHPKAKSSPQHLFIAGCVFCGLAIMYGAGAFTDYKEMGARTNQILFALGWGLSGVEQLRRARDARRASTS